MNFEPRLLTGAFFRVDPLIGVAVILLKSCRAHVWSVPQLQAEAQHDAGKIGQQRHQGEPLPEIDRVTDLPMQRRRHLKLLSQISGVPCKLPWQSIATTPLKGSPAVRGA